MFFSIYFKKSYQNIGFLPTLPIFFTPEVPYVRKDVFFATSTKQKKKIIKITSPEGDSSWRNDATAVNSRNLFFPPVLLQYVYSLWRAFPNRRGRGTVPRVSEDKSCIMRHTCVCDCVRMCVCVCVCVRECRFCATLSERVQRFWSSL